jgi:hypothetical protein
MYARWFSPSSVASLAFLKPTRPGAKERRPAAKTKMIRARLEREVKAIGRRDNPTRPSDRDYCGACGLDRSGWELSANFICLVAGAPFFKLRSQCLLQASACKCGISPSDEESTLTEVSSLSSSLIVLPILVCSYPSAGQNFENLQSGTSANELPCEVPVYHHLSAILPKMGSCLVAWNSFPAAVLLPMMRLPDSDWPQPHHTWLDSASLNDSEAAFWFGNES